MPKPVYLDYHATTPVDPRVLEVMLPYFTEDFGNPASRQHGRLEGRGGGRAARGRVAALIGATAREIVFTSGATESNNLAIKGVARACRERRHITSSRSAIEHKSVLEACKSSSARAGVSPGSASTATARRLDELRAAVTRPDRARLGHGRQQRDWRPAAARRDRRRSPARRVRSSIPTPRRPRARCRSTCRRWASTCSRSPGTRCTARRAAARSTSGARSRGSSSPPIDGGGQERGLRSGTLNVPGIVGLGRAGAICRTEMAAESARLAALRDRLLEGLRHALDGVA